MVETLGLVKKNKKRVSRESDLVKTGAALLPLAHEEAVTEAKEKASRGYDGGSNLGITPDGVDRCRCAQEVECLNSIETTPAKWSFSQDRLGVLTIDRPAFPNVRMSYVHHTKHQKTIGFLPKALILFKCTTKFFEKYWRKLVLWVECFSREGTLCRASCVEVSRRKKKRT